ncbi:hypothetical protein QCA50_000041 [Cerrena zonata]|uniref:Protein PBN1 n=1 Tax=Cerrena zonata TaxID=2478898 RepID=A0AAW0GVQ4_9APHY
MKVDQEGTEAAETRYAKYTIDIIDCSSTLVLDDASAKQRNVDVVTLRIPVGSRRDLDLVELSTTVVVLGLLAYLLWVFWNTARRITSRRAIEKNQ